MAKIKIDIKGIEELQKKLKKNANPSDVKFIVRQNGAELQKRMQEKADFTKGYATGTTKRSIGLEITDSGFTAEVGPETEYAPCNKIGRSIWQHMFENWAKSVKILKKM